MPKFSISIVLTDADSNTLHPIRYNGSDDDVYALVNRAGDVISSEVRAQYPAPPRVTLTGDNAPHLRKLLDMIRDGAGLEPCEDPKCPIHGEPEQDSDISDVVES